MNSSRSELIDRALSCMQRGGIVAAPTESSYGLLVDASNTQALDALFHLKRRAPSRAVALIIPNRSEWRKWVTEVPRLAERWTESFWPGPLTVALQANEGVDPRLQVAGTVGVRQPGPSLAADLVQRFGRGVTATSANLAGEPPALSSQELHGHFGEFHEDELFVVEGRCPGGPPSTVVVVGVDGAWTVARQGVISEAQLKSVVAVHGADSPNG